MVRQNTISRLEAVKKTCDNEADNISLVHTNSKHKVFQESALRELAIAKRHIEMAQQFIKQI